MNDEDLHLWSGLYATDARLMLKATLAPYRTGERALLATLLPELERTDLLLMDRGFPAVWLFTLLQQRGLPFLERTLKHNFDFVGCFADGRALFSWQLAKSAQ